MVAATGPGAVARPPAWRRVAIVTVPWLVAAALVLSGLVRGDRPTGPADEAVAPRGTTAASPASPVASPSPHAAVTATSPGAPDTPGLDATTTLAVLAAARRALGTAGLPGDGAAAERWPVEVRIAEVRDVGRGLAVATVGGLVIAADGAAWTAPEPGAVAVLVRTGSEPAVVGEAWPIPAPRLPHEEPALHPVGDPGPTLVDPLEADGWVIDEVTHVAATDDALLRVQLRGIAPGARRRAAHAVWLRDAPDGPQLLTSTTSTHGLDDR